MTGTKKPKLRFTLLFMLRLVLYSALIALCSRLFWQSQPANNAAKAWSQGEGWLDPQIELELENAGQSAIPRLVRELKTNHNVSVQVKVLHSLERIHADISPAVPTIIGTLDNKNRRVRKAAVQALGVAGRTDNDAIDALVSTIKDDDESVRLAVVNALWQAQTIPGFDFPRAHPKPIVIAAIAEMLFDLTPSVRVAAAEALARFGENGRLALPRLLDALQDDDPQVAAAVARAVALVRQQSAYNDAR